MTNRGPALDEPVLGALGAQLGGDPLTGRALLRDHADVGEEQRAVLHVQTALQLLVLDHRAVQRRNFQLAPPREPVLVALIGVLGVALEQRRRGSQGELNERRRPAGRHGRDQTVHRRRAVVLEAVDQLDPLYEGRMLLAAHHARRHARRAFRLLETTVRVGRAQGSLHDLARLGRAAHGEPCLALVVNLERDRRLAPDQPAPPPSQQALVERLVHVHDRLRGGVVTSIGHHSETDIASRPPRAQTKGDEDQP